MGLSPEWLALEIELVPVCAMLLDLSHVVGEGMIMRI